MHVTVCWLCETVRHDMCLAPLVFFFVFSLSFVLPSRSLYYKCLSPHCSKRRRIDICISGVSVDFFWILWRPFDALIFYASLVFLFLLLIFFSRNHLALGWTFLYTLNISFYAYHSTLWIHLGNTTEWSYKSERKARKEWKEKRKEELKGD